MSRKIISAAGTVTIDRDFVAPDLREAVPIERKRARATMTRAQFLKACVAARIITAEVAEEAATGQWPTAFDAFIAGLTSDQRIDAKATWADGGSVHRDNAILALIAADQGVSDAQLDAMFGIE